MSKNDASTLGLTLLGALAVAWGCYGLLAAANGQDGANPVVGLVFVLIGVAVVVAAWLSRRSERTD